MTGNFENINKESKNDRKILKWKILSSIKNPKLCNKSRQIIPTFSKTKN